MSDKKDNRPNIENSFSMFRIRKGFHIRAETIQAIKFGGDRSRFRMIIYTNIKDHPTMDIESITEMQKIIKEINNKDITAEFESLIGSNIS
jgi:hypothetical protein